MCCALNTLPVPRSESPEQTHASFSNIPPHPAVVTHPPFVFRLQRYTHSPHAQRDFPQLSVSNSPSPPPIPPQTTHHHEQSSLTHIWHFPASNTAPQWVSLASGLSSSLVHALSNSKPSLESASPSTPRSGSINSSKPSATRKATLSAIHTSLASSAASASSSSTGSNLCLCLMAVLPC